MTAMEPTTRSHHRLVTVLILAITVLGIVVVASDWQDMREVLLQADWRYLPIVLLFTIASYACYSYGYAYVCELLGIQMGKRELAMVCFISTVVNHVLTTGGVAGYSVRYLLMRMYKVSFKDLIASSFLHYYLTSLDMLTFLPISFIYLLYNANVPRGIAIALGIMTLLFGLVLVVTTVMVLFPSRRYPIIQVLGILGKKILRRDYLPWLIQLDGTLTYATEGIRKRPLLLGWIMLLTLVDFACSIIAMGFVFEALGPGVDPPALVTGYVIGIMAGL